MVATRAAWLASDLADGDLEAGRSALGFPGGDLRGQVDQGGFLGDR